MRILHLGLTVTLFLIIECTLKVYGSHPTNAAALLASSAHNQLTNCDFSLSDNIPSDVCSSNNNLKILSMADFTYLDTCVNSPTSFAVIYSGTDSVFWDFGDLPSGPLNFSTDTIPQHTYITSGNYTIKCIVFAGLTSDTVSKLITISPLPSVYLGPDTTICNGNTITLVAGSNPGATYLWQNGATTSSIVAATSQAYIATVTENGCSATDSINITLKNVLIFPATDTTICNGSKVFLDISNSPNIYTYQWSDGFPDPFRFIDTAGTFVATVTIGSCQKSSTFILHTLNKPTIYLGEDTILCSGGTWLLNATYPSSTYLWQDGSTNPTFSAVSTDTYGVQVSNQCGIDADSIYIEFNACGCNVYFPKAFTPNSDNHNEVYNYKFDCLSFSPTFRIFNRWGTLVFESNDVNTGWDGNYKGKAAVEDAYIYVLKYSGVIDGKIQEDVKRGMFLLFR